MLSKLKVSLLVGISALSISIAQARENPWPKVEKEMKPWTRWWWPGSAVDKANIEKLLTKYHEAGIGGVEITPIYGAKGFESRYLKFLSPEWLTALNQTVKKADALSMGVDMNTGTGWPFGGPQIQPEQAATKLIIQQYELKAGDYLAEAINVKEAKQDAAVLQAVTAYDKNNKPLSLTDKVDASGKLQWTPPSGKWKIYAAFAGKTRQMVKRAAPGGEGFTLDHLNKNSVDIYLSRFDQAFQNKAQGIRAFFNDSYEVYGADWSPLFFEEFKKLHGYDLANYLNILADKKDHSELAGRIKSDYRETMNELLLENFTRQWTKWAHQHQSLSKNQSHGSPGNLLDLYGAVDIPECETFGSSYFPIPGLRRDSADIRNVDPDPMMFKFATSAANINGKKYTSSETFTWLTEHFKTSLSQMKPEAEALLLAGVNHIFYHGTTYSPSDVPFPGWLFYASSNIVPDNSWWPHLQGLNRYLTRVQSVLQSSKADNEILLYWPVYDVWKNPEGLDVALKVHDVDEWLHPTKFYQTATNLSAKGYSFDFVSDKVIGTTVVDKGKLITNVNALPYQTLVIPAAKTMSVGTVKKILDIAKSGASVIFQDLPSDVPGLNFLKERREELQHLLKQMNFKTENGLKVCPFGTGKIYLTDDVESALHDIHVEREQLADCGLKFIRKAAGDAKYYYIVNHTGKDINELITINEKAGAVLLMNPLDGYYGLAESAGQPNGTKVKIQLKSGQSLILKTLSGETGFPKWVYLNENVSNEAVKGKWNLSFTSGGPELPKSRQLNELKPWTMLQDSVANNFSGLGVYSTTFKFKPKAGEEYLLTFDKIYESAHVWLNGHDLGVVWSFPSEIRLKNYLRKGKNELKIEVANLMANRIRYMDRNNISWRNYHEINFVNINYQPFDASNWAVMPSGLDGQIRIKGYK